MHGVSRDDIANIINNASRKFVGVNDNGRPVNIFWKADTVVFTQGDDVTRVISAYGKAGTRGKNKPVNPNRWEKGKFHEVLD